MKVVRKLVQGTAVAVVAAAVALVGAGTAQADVVSGSGYVGQYWCEGDAAMRVAATDGWIGIHVASSDFGKQGQTMQFKAVHPADSRAYGYSGWFAIPNYLNRVAWVEEGTPFKLCATFGGGPRNTPFHWAGNVEYP